MTNRSLEIASRIQQQVGGPLMGELVRHTVHIRLAAAIDAELAAAGLDVPSADPVRARYIEAVEQALETLLKENLTTEEAALASKAILARVYRGVGGHEK